VRFLVFAPTGGFCGLSIPCIHPRAAQSRRNADARLLGFARMLQKPISAGFYTIAKKFHCHTLKMNSARNATVEK